MIYIVLCLLALTTVVASIGWVMSLNPKPKSPTETLVSTLMERLNASEKERRKLSLKLKKAERENERLCEEKLHAWDIPDKV